MRVSSVALGTVALIACSGQNAEPVPYAEDVWVEVAPEDVALDSGGRDVVLGDSVVRDVPDVLADSGADADSSGRLEISFARLEDGDFVWGRQVLGVVATGGPDRVIFSLDGVVLRDDAEPPFAAIFDAEALVGGAYDLGVRASRSDGEVAEAVIQVRVDRERPTVNILEPGTVYDGPVAGLLRVEVSATDNHEVVLVVLKIDREQVAELVPPQFAVDLPVELEEGQYTLEATAFDRTGLSRGTSVEIYSCPDGQVSCVGGCLEFSLMETSIADCGACGLECGVGELCAGGECLCPSPRVLCDASCTDVGRDIAHCGECENACGAGEGCLAGACISGVPEGFALIGPAEFEMGSDPGDWASEPQEQPVHSVTLTRPYLMAETETTHEQWSRFFAENPSAAWDCGPRCPVESVTWFEAVEYANALSESEGLRPCYLLGGCDDTPIGFGRRCISVFIDAPGQNPAECEGYRLPTEAEWEFAARGGSTGNAYSGAVSSYQCSANSSLDAVAWYTCNAGGRPQPTRELQPNSYGLYDVLGNVFEWTGDLWGDYPSAPQVDPLGPSTDIVIRPIRGGGFNERSARTRTQARLSQDPAVGLLFVGFRLARTFQP
jgi:formylglycine-generating enzyme required for sulfatase activity